MVANFITKEDDAHQTVSVILELNQGQKYRVRSIQIVGLEEAMERDLRAKLKRGDVMNTQLLRDFYAENKAELAANASVSDVKMTRDTQNGTVDLSFDFRALPH